MKKSKLLAPLLALILVMAFALPAFAAPISAPFTNNGTITITAPEHHNLAASSTYTLFQLYDLVNITGSTAPYQFVYTPNASVKAYLTWVANGASGWNATMLYPKPTLAAYEVTTSPSVNMTQACEEFRQWLQKFDGSAAGNEIYDAAKIIELATMMVLSSKYGGVDPALATPTFISNPPNSLQFTGLQYAYYLVVGEGVHETNTTGTPNVTRGILVNVPEYEDYENGTGNLTKDAKRVLKIDVPTVEKEVKEDQENTNPADDTWEKETDKNIGDTVDYKITSAVPDTTGYLGYSFIVTDILSKGLTLTGTPTPGSGLLSGHDISIKIGAATYPSSSFSARLLGPGAGTLNQANLGKLWGVYDFANDPYILDGGHLLIIDFIPGDDEAIMRAFMAMTPGTPIEITYTATLNEDAVIGSDGNPNKVILFYNTNPTASPCVMGKTPPDETIVYTFDIDVLKVDGEETTVKLAGAEFELKNAAGAVLKFKHNPTGNVYKLAADQSAAGLETILVSDADGVIRIIGLDEGTYTLTETKAPIGYNLLEDPITVVIEHAGGGSYTVKNGTFTGTVTIGNFTGGVLPGTGGIGTTVFYAVGAILALLLAAAFVVYKRKRSLGVLLA